LYYFILGVLLGLNTIDLKRFAVNRMRLLTLVLPLFLLAAFTYGDFGLSIATNGKIYYPFQLPVIFLFFRNSEIARLVMFTALGFFLITALFHPKNAGKSADITRFELTVTAKEIQP
jgi:hypothetical protein